MFYLPRYLNLTSEVVCQTIGHRVTFYDSGYEVCARCGAHGYYDYAKFAHDWYNPVFHFLAWLETFDMGYQNLRYHIGWNFRRCQMCGKFNFICRRSNCENNEIPF